MNGFKILRIECVNVNSLINKVLYVKHLAARHQLSVVAICEAWLVSSVSSSFVAVDGFQVVRGDGSDSIRKHGCCLYIADSLSFVSVEVDLLNVAVVFLRFVCSRGCCLQTSILYCCTG